MNVSIIPLSETPSSTPTTDIFIKTYKGDAEYHKYCIESIRKFCKGFRQIVVVDDGDVPPPRPYIFQQKIKLYADAYTDADYIWVTDSDTLNNQHVTPESFMVDGKPVWIHTPWTPEMLAHEGLATWKRVMTEFFGEEPYSEKMRRQPFMFPRGVLKSLRKFCVAQHGVDLETYIMRAPAFSEWNVLGEFCWRHHHDEFHWIDSSKDELPPLYCTQLWSHTPIADNMEKIQQILNQ